MPQYCLRLEYLIGNRWANWWLTNVFFEILTYTMVVEYLSCLRKCSDMFRELQCIFLNIYIIASHVHALYCIDKNYIFQTVGKLYYSYQRKKLYILRKKNWKFILFLNWFNWKGSSKISYVNHTETYTHKFN